MAIPLAKRAPAETPTAPNDDIHISLSLDPTVPQFAPGSGYGYPAPPMYPQPPAIPPGQTTNINASVGANPVLTGAGENAMTDGAFSPVPADEHWLNRHWRPMMAYLYMITCAFDFVLFPILWSILHAYVGQPITQWQPLTLQGAGLYHMAMGTVLGVAAYGRTKEKIAGLPPV
jgi:hypothetical protein